VTPSDIRENQLPAGLDRAARSTTRGKRRRRRQNSSLPHLANGLPPRLRRTLKLLLSGHSEKRVARELNLSPHTVHEYVKDLYIHFAVSSRAELMAKWIKG
jgi:DNA-binding NarL/FixJ family response regulator